MGNDLITQKSWWQRNRLWFLPLIVLTVSAAVVFFTSGTTAYMGDLALIHKEPQLYRDAMEQAKGNARVEEALGVLQPVDNLALVEGNVVYSDDKNSVRLTIPVKGSKGKAKLDIAAQREDAVWKYSLIKIRIKQPAEEIIVYN